MKSLVAEAFSVWRGTWKEGAGIISTRTETLEQQPYTYASRFEGAPGANPEELLAAAHAGCFNQALANDFGMIGLEAALIETSVQVQVDQEDNGRPTISNVHITVHASVPRASDAQFEECTEKARANCSISRILKCPITLTATWS